VSSVPIDVPSFDAWLKSIAGDPLPPWGIDELGLEDDNEGCT